MNCTWTKHRTPKPATYRFRTAVSGEIFVCDACKASEDWEITLTKI
jgi:hypothetical protein